MGCPRFAPSNLAEVYGTSLSKETVSKITDAVIEEMTDWLNRRTGRVRLSNTNRSHQP
jgi:transposase-like protein